MLNRRRRDGTEVSMNTAFPLNSASPAAVSTRQFAKWPALVALAFGVLVVFGAGFASPSAIHNATHDTRHAFGLPCH
jgi:cobalt transporter subunit CbtB